MVFDPSKVDLDSLDSQVDTGSELQFENVNNHLRSTMDEAFKVDPVSHSKIVDLSRDSGVPEFAVQSDPTDVEHNLKLNGIDFNEVSTQSPKTAKFLSDFNNAVTGQGDIDVLRELEDIFDFSKTFQNFSESNKLGFESQGLGLLAAGTDRGAERIQDIISPITLPPGLEGDAFNMSLQIAKNLGVESDEELQQLKEESTTAMITQLKEVHGKRAKLTPADMNILEQGVRAGADSLYQMAPGFSLMVLSGGRAAPLLGTIGLQTFSESYGKGRAEGLTPEESTWFASIDAAIEVGTELLPTKTLETIITGASKGLTKSALKFAVQEMGTEQLATLGQSINSFAFGLDKQMDQAETVQEMIDIQLQRQAVTAIATVVAGGAQISAVTAVRKTVEGFTQNEQAKETQGQIEQKKIDQINTSSNNSELKQLDPQSFKQFVEEADGDNNTNVFIDGAQTSLYLQGITQEEIEADFALSLMNDQVQEASRLGGDVVIPVADLATYLSGTEHFDALRPHMTMSAETVSPFRQEQQQEESQNYVRALLDEAQESTSEFVEANRIYETVRDQLVDTGMVNTQNANTMAQLVPAWATVYGKQNGLSVEEVYRTSGLTIEGPQTGELARVSDEALEQAPAFKDAFVFFERARDKFLDVLPEDATVDDVLETVDEFSPEYQQFINQLDQNDWLGFDHPSQAIDAVFSEDFEGFDLSQGLKASIGRLVNAELGGRDVFAQGEVKPTAVEQVQPDKNLFVAHNLSAENILAASDLGGLAAPSLAVARADVSDFSGFGEVTLLADPSLLDDPKARTFDADVYTPRQPRATYDINQKRYNKFRKDMEASIEGIPLNLPDIGALEEQTGADALLRSDSVKYDWLKGQDKSPKLKNKKVEPVVKKALKLDLNKFELIEDTKFIKMVSAHYKKLVEQIETADPIRGERYSDFYFHEDGAIKDSKLRDIAGQVDSFRRSSVDASQLRSDISNKFRNKKLNEQFEQHVTTMFNEMVDGKTLFKGFTDAGNKKFTEYNMVNVVREMTQSLQGGEVSFYGAPSVRAAFANEMKTIAQVQARRDQIIPEEDLAEIKEDSVSIFENALEDLKPFYKFDADSWGYTEDVGTAIMEGPKGLREVFTRVTPEVKKIVDDLTEYLSSLPSTYFETKVQRAVGFDEFNTAIVPKGLRKDSLQVLKDANLKIKTYDPKTEGARAEVIAKQTKLLFQPTDTDGVRGFYDPANSVIRLTEAADLSTFLHEFAHFMYEMELKANSENIESVNGWYKRNAEAVAKEANEFEPNTIILPRHVVEFLDNGTTGDKERDMGVRTAVHENFARGFEQYLMEGKAPSIELRNAFATFARWLTQIYRNLRDGLKVNLDAEMRQVYDRLLATEEQIAAASSRARHEPMFTDAAMAGMTEQEFNDYQQQLGEVKDKQTETLREKLIKQLTRTNQKWWNEEKSDLVDEEVDRLKDEQVYRTAARLSAPVKDVSTEEIEQIVSDIKSTEKQIKTLKKDNDTLIQFISKAGGLNKLAFVEEGIDQADIKTAPRKVFGKPMFRKEGGLTPDGVAEILNEMDNGDRTANDALELVSDALQGNDPFVNLDAIGELTDLENQLENLEQAERDAREAIRTVNIKLDHAATKSMIGEQVTDKLGRKSTRISTSLRGMTAKGGEGVHPDEAATFFGYRSGSQMLNALVKAPKIEVLAETNAEQAMIEKHGDIMTDGTIEQQADEAVQSEERGKLLLTELKAVSRGTNQPAIDRQTVKALAAEQIGKLSFRDNQPGKYRKAEIRAAQESATALANGDKAGAALAKARQVLNYYLGIEATKAKNETAKIVDRMTRYNKKKVREEIMKAENGYWEQIVKILNRFEFRKAASLASVEAVNQDINTWTLDRIENDGDGLVISPAVMNESYVTHWKNVPFSDLQGVNDSVKNIEHVARYGNKIRLADEKRDFKKVVSDWVDHMNTQPDVFTPQRTTAIEPKNWLRAGMAQMTKVPFLASWLDGGERVGMSHDLLMSELNVAGKQEQELWSEVGDVVMTAIESRSKDDQNRHLQKIFIPEIQNEQNDGNLTGGQVLAVALNTGNQGNLRKMLLGEGWVENEDDVSIDNPQLQAVLQHVTKKDWDLVQLVWDQMNELYPRLAEVHRRTTGLVPPKVESTPVKTEFGTFRGGYYPVKYDHHRSSVAARNKDRLDAQVESMFGGSLSLQASVNTGSTNERTGFYGPILFDLGVVPNHFQETIHYITHHDAVRQINKLISDPSVRGSITAKLGRDEYAQLRPWLNDVAKDGASAPPKTFIDAAFNRLRMGVTLGVMGFKASTGIIQISGIFNTYAEVGSKHVHKAMRTVYGRGLSSMEDAKKFAFENSNIMENRTKTMDREIKNALQKLEGKRGVLPVLQEASMKHIAFIQFYGADLLSWHAAYTSKLEETGDVDRAYKYADWVVENIQGSGATKDMATVFRNQSKTHTTFTMFMTFFSALWNMERDLVRGAKSGRYSPSSVAAKSMFLFTLPVLFEMMMRGELDDEDEALAEKTLTKLALYPVASVPFVRDVASGIGSGYGYNSSPVASTIEKGVQGLKGVANAALSDKEITKGQAKGATKFVGAAVGVPGVNQVWATGEHIYDVIEEGEELTIHQLLFGPERK